MSKEIFKALTLLEQEKGISVDFMVDKIKKAIAIACKSNYGGNDDVIVDIDPPKGKFNVYLRKTVVDDEEITNLSKEISLSDARNIDPSVGIEEKVAIKLDTKEFGRIAAQTARNMIRQGIKDGERFQLLQELQSLKKELVSAQVDRMDPKTGAATLKIGKAVAVLPKVEQIGEKNLKEGDIIKVYIADVKETEKGPKAVISRTHPDMIKRLFEREVPEIYEGIVEIKSVSREAGSRTKIAVFSNDENIDPIGSCIGAKGARVTAIGNDLGGEKIDIVEYSEDPKKFIASSLAPADVLKVDIKDEDEHTCCAVVNDAQLSLAIGNKGQNVRLAARLTGWKIDIKSKSGYEKEAEEIADNIDTEAKENAEDLE